MMGSNGISEEFGVARHLVNLEVVNTDQVSRINRLKAQPIIESALSRHHSPPEQTPHQQRLKILRLPSHRVNVGVALRLAVQDAVMRT